MRYKSMPLSVRYGRAPEPPPPPAPSRSRDWLGVLMATALVVLPLLSIGTVGSYRLTSDSPYLEANGAATVGEELKVVGGSFEPRSWVQLTWDGNPAGMPRVRVDRKGELSAAIVPAQQGSHTIAAVAGEKGKGKVTTAAIEFAALVVDVQPKPDSTPTPTPTPTPEPPPSPSPTASPSPTPSPTASPSPSPSPTASPSHTPSPTASLTPSPTATVQLSPSPSASPSPTTSPTAAPDPARPVANMNRIWFGAFFDHNWRNNPTTFSAMIDDLQARGLDSAMSVNGFVRHHEPLLAISDAKQFPIFTGMMQGELNEQWWNRKSWNEAAAEEIIGPLVDRIKTHPSVMGYNLNDDAHFNQNEPMRLAQRATERHDPRRLASPTMTKDIGWQVYRYVQPTVFLMYNYPCRDGQAAMSWVNNWVSELRNNTRERAPGVPWFLALQTHNTNAGPAGTTLRYPTVEEIRAQAWLALGEDVDGIWWFHYDDNPSGEWKGFRNQPSIYTEISDLARRVTAIEAVLGPLVKIADAYSSNGYTSTMRAPDGRTYVLAVNKSASAQAITVSGAGSALRNVETGQTYQMGQSIPLRGGDGSLFEVTR